jgi:hypothetical protein
MEVASPAGMLATAIADYLVSAQHIGRSVVSAPEDCDISIAEVSNEALCAVSPLSSKAWWKFSTVEVQCKVRQLKF